MQASGGSLADYLALFRRRRTDLLGRGEPTGYGKTVATTWALAFTRLEQFDAGAVGCFGCWHSARRRRSRCACCCIHAQVLC